MKPARLKLTHHLILAYGLYRKLEVYKPHLASPEELARFHSDDYIDFLRRVTPETSRSLGAFMSRFNMGEFTDCPVFSDLFPFCQSYAGASIDGAVRLNHGHADVAINWSGGLHHAKKGEASGFCYVNDIVLAILELLKHHQRVLYIDIDVHHGDGVEEAFYTTDRVMTVSFHKFGDFFPGTGSIRDTGARVGKNYSVNFPLQDGIDDESYSEIFKKVMSKVMESYQPGAIVLQCGADSLTADRLGVFNLTLKGHAECVRFMKTFGKPLLLLGGGGYTIRNVARCWAYETATALDVALPDVIPPNDYIEFYRPDYRLHLDPSPSLENANSRSYLDKCTALILEQLASVAHAPSVQFQHVPPDMVLREVDAEVRREAMAAARAAARDGPLAGARIGSGAAAAADERDSDRLPMSSIRDSAAMAAALSGESGAGAGAGTGPASGGLADLEGRRAGEGELYDGDGDLDAGDAAVREAEADAEAAAAAAAAAPRPRAAGGALPVMGRRPAARPGAGAGAGAGAGSSSAAAGGAGVAGAGSGSGAGSGPFRDTRMDLAGLEDALGMGIDGSSSSGVLGAGGFPGAGGAGGVLESAGAGAGAGGGSRPGIVAWNVEPSLGSPFGSAAAASGSSSSGGGAGGGAAAGSSAPADGSVMGHGLGVGGLGIGLASLTAGTAAAASAPSADSGMQEDVAGSAAGDAAGGSIDV